MRLIDAEPLIKFCTYCADDVIVKIDRNTMAKMLAQAPTVDAICPHYIRNEHDRGDDSLCRKFQCEVSALPRKTGKWIDDNCSVCGFYVHHGDARNYCPNCGSKMEGGQDE